MLYVVGMTVTPAQCRAARGLLALSQTELAILANVSLKTIQNFEGEKREPIPATLAALRRALEEAGVIFIPTNGEGVGVRLRRLKPGDASPDAH